MYFERLPVSYGNAKGVRLLNDKWKDLFGPAEGDGQHSHVVGKVTDHGTVSPRALLHLGIVVRVAAQARITSSKHRVERDESCRLFPLVAVVDLPEFLDFAPRGLVAVRQRSNDKVDRVAHR